MTGVSIRPEGNGKTGEVDFICDVTLSGVQEEETIIIEIEWLLDQAIAESTSHKLNERIALPNDKWKLGQEVTSNSSRLIDW